MEERSTLQAAPTGEQRGVPDGAAMGLPAAARGLPGTGAPALPITSGQSLGNPAVWVFRSDSYAFTVDAANGWDASYGFNNLQGLVDALGEHGHAARRVRKLGICAPGNVGGSVQIASATHLTAAGIDQMQTLIGLTRLDAFLTPDAQVIFFSCAAGQGQSGTLFLRRISRLWRTRTIIGFTTFGYLDTSASARNAPGNIYDTEATTQTAARIAGQEIQAGRRKMPRMNENNRTAKWVRSDRVLRAPKVDV